MKHPRGNRRSKVLVEHDMIALVERMQLHNEDATDAGKALGIPARKAQRLARKGLLRVLAAASREKIKAIATADENPNPMARGQFELPEPIQTAPLPQEDVIASSAIPVATPPVEPASKAESVHEEPWEWEHLMSREEFLKRDPWRQKQLIAAWIENQYLSGKPFQPVLRGGIKNRNCFRGCPSYQCTCEDNL